MIFFAAALGSSAVSHSSADIRMPVMPSDAFEVSHRAGGPMTTGSGKTFTTVNFAYRLIKHADARRVLFLVDRSNLGRQALKEFQE